ncbi:MAG: hypothetical protein QOG16_478 [Actinomycetota bacterium]|nr:hypothetical protein [Actinomycetota bacterium]
MIYPSAMRRLAICLTLLAVLVAACGDEAERGGSPDSPDRLEGVIVSIDSVAIDDVNSFTLKDGSDTYELFIADDVDYGFPLGHLQEHVQSAAPVACDIEERNGKLFALTIEDV